MDLINKLYQLGFLENVIVEAIISTYNPNNEPNAAPMGIIMNEKKQLLIRPFINTRTYQNIVRNGCAVINITSKAELYYQTTFKDGKIPLEWFESAKLVNAPRLKKADAYLETSVINIQQYEKDRVEILLKIEMIDLKDKYIPQVYCRANFMVIESIIHATRIQAFLSQGRFTDLDELMRMIQHYNNIIQRIAPNSIYSTIMLNLIERVNKWRSNINGRV